MARALADAPRVGARIAHPVWIAIAPGLLALGICLWQLSYHHALSAVTGVDDGVYLGAALKLVAGIMPYRDYVLVQPPGIAVLMSPIALIGRAIGSEDALEIARVATAFVTATNASFVAWLVRHHGLAAMLIGGTAAATFPLAVTADHTLALEPYVVLFVLLGSIVAFNRNIPSGWRLFSAGLLFGVAGSIKIWAAFPLLALLAGLLPKWRHLVAAAAGAAGGFAAVCLPFVIGAPHAFLHDVLADQLFRSATPLNQASVGYRLIGITGLGGIPALPDSVALAVVLLVALGLGLIVSYGADWRGFRRIDAFLILAAIASIVGIAEAPEFYAYYTYFPSPFLAALAGIAIAGVGRAAWRRSRLTRLDPRRKRFLGLVPWVLGAMVLFGVITEDVIFSRSYFPHILLNEQGAALLPGPAIDAVIPRGSCVVYDEAVLGIEANRFLATSQTCPSVVDPYGMWLADAGGKSPPAFPPYPVRFVALWRSYLVRAQYVVLGVPESDVVPWTRALLRWFDSNYALVTGQPGVYIYRHELSKHDAAELSALPDERGTAEQQG